MCPTLFSLRTPIQHVIPYRTKQCRTKMKKFFIGDENLIRKIMFEKSDKIVKVTRKFYDPTLFLSDKIYHV